MNNGNRLLTLCAVCELSSPEVFGQTALANSMLNKMGSLSYSVGLFLHSYCIALFFTLLGCKELELLRETAGPFCLM